MRTKQETIDLLLDKGRFCDIHGRCEQLMTCRLCKQTWYWEDELAKHSEDCPLYKEDEA